jgi:hypothetical protein
VAVSGDGRDRGLIEDAVTLLLSVAPPEWAQMHGEFEPCSQPPLVVASVMTTTGEWQPLAVSSGVLSVLAEQQRMAAATGAPWGRLTVECSSDGLLSAWTENGPVPMQAHQPVPGPWRARRWPQRVLAAMTAGYLIAAAVVFAVGWQWGPPPRVGMIPVPATPPLQQQAFDAVSGWLNAQNRADGDAVAALTCAHPSPLIAFMAGQYRAAHVPPPDKYEYAEAVTVLHEEGAQVKVNVPMRVVGPMNSDKSQREAAAFGVIADLGLVLVDEGGHLKVCDMEAVK